MNEKEAVGGEESYFVFPLSIALLSALAFFAAANSAWMPAIFAATTLLLMLGVRLWARLGLSRLDVSLACSGDRLFPGESFTLRADIANRKILPVWMCLELSRPEELKPLAPEEIGGEVGLLPFEKVSGSWAFSAERRGVHRLGPAKIIAGDLLGFCRKEKKLSFGRDIVVFPRLLPLRDLEPPFRDYFGIHPAKGIIEDPAWYEGTREYSGNKPARNIHWKASARLAVLQEKIFEPTSHKKIFFLLDGQGFESAEDGGGFETALEVLGSLAARFAETGASFALATDRAVRGRPAVLPLGRGPEHLGAFLELLARCESDRGRPMVPLVRAVGSSGAGFVVVSRCPGENTKKYFNLPATRRDRVLFVFSRGGKIGGGAGDSEGDRAEGDAESRARAAYPFTTFDALLIAREKV